MRNPKSRRSLRLEVEQLESRVVPSTVTPPATPDPPYYGWGSTNWSGMSLNTTTGGVTGVSGSWTVAAVPQTTNSQPTALSSSWVGIDGFSSSTVEQIGTGSDTGSYGSLPSYYAWFEMYPAGIVQITTATSLTTPPHPARATVVPDDSISASVTYDHSSGKGPTTTSTFILTITDSTQNWMYTTTQTVQGSPQRSSAEWIEEAPSSSRGVLPLANFGSVTFTNAQATISNSSGNSSGTILSLANSNNPSILNYGSPPRPINLIDMGTFNRQGQWTSIKDETSLLDSTGAGFTVTSGTPSTQQAVLSDHRPPKFAPNQGASGQGTTAATGTPGSDLAASVNLALVSGQLNQAATQAQQTNAAIQAQPVVIVTTVSAVPAATPPLFLAGRLISPAQSLPSGSPDGSTDAPAPEQQAPKMADPAADPGQPKANPEGAGNPIVPAGPQAQPQGVWDGDLVWRAGDAGPMELRWANAAGAATGKNESNADTVLDTMLALTLSACWIHGKEEEEHRRRRTDFGAIA